ncbi:MAG TPA: beta/gamma crystallin-related protein [Casimicrobiaceae bacterium]|nr:beta/gamma crystallin-related protein [Casimicrobiaceae bacterium]
MRHLHWLLGGIVALVATAALAGEITLYQHPGFQGRNITTGDAVPNLARAGFNDMASSVVVRSGIWEVCTDAYFHGNCATLRPGEYQRIDSTLNDRISSARQIGHEPVPPNAVVTSPPVAVVTPPPEDPRIVLHEHTRSGVKSVELTTGVRDLDSIGFSDRADSATVYGGVWRLCDREGGGGTTCVEFGPGYYDHLGALDRNVRSALVVGEARAAVAVPAVAPRVFLYEFPDFAGRSLSIESSEARDLMWQRFAARAGSIRVFGGSWMFCTGPNFSGECLTLGPGEYPRLGPDLDHRIASARLVSNVYLGMRGR